jgi:hypothetical protein
MRNDSKHLEERMSNRRKLLMLALLAVCSLLPRAVAGDNSGDELVFIVAADMRNYAKDGEWSTNFSGACEAVKEVGMGDFMISPGDLDVDPPSAVREMISTVLGDAYPWYPVIGNHDPESPSTMDYLREYGRQLPNLVRRGPAGCETTTYSFDWGNSHFVVLNIYYDGAKDWGTGGDVVPELLEWLEADLAANTKRHVFVVGHEPLVAIPDMDNGRHRHQGDSLDENPESAFQFHQLMLRYDVTAYICGHSHGASVAKINGLWQLDSGHARGLEAKSDAEAFYAAIKSAIERGRERGEGEQSSLKQLYRDDPYHVDRWIKYLGLKSAPVTQAMAQFYNEYTNDPNARQRFYEVQIKNRQQTRSTFMRITVGDQEVTVEVYRDDAHGGPYSLRKTVMLN